MKTIKELKKTAQELGLSNDAVRQHGDLRRKPTWEKAIAARESIVDSLERIYNSPSVSVGVEAIEMFKESFVRPVSAPVPEPEPEEEGDRENPPGESQEISKQIVTLVPEPEEGGDRENPPGESEKIVVPEPEEGGDRENPPGESQEISGQAVTPVLEPEPEEGKLVSPWWLPDKNKASAIATAYCNSVGVVYDDFVSDKLEYWLLVSSCDCLFSDTTFTFFVRQNENRGLLDWLNAAKAAFGKKLVPFDDYWIFATDLRPWTILELSLALDTPIYLKNHLDHWDPKCGSLIEPKYFCSDLPYKYYSWGIQVDVELPIQGFMPAQEIPQHIWTPMPEPEPEEGGDRENPPGESEKIVVPEPEEGGDRENPPGESQEISEQIVAPVLEPEPEEGGERDNPPGEDEEFSADTQEVDVLPIGMHPRNRAIAEKLMSKFKAIYLSPGTDLYAEGGWGKKFDLESGWRAVVPGSRLSDIDHIELELEGEVFTEVFTINIWENVALGTNIADLTVENALQKISACIRAAASEWDKHFGKQLELFEGEVSYVTL